jgi:hypothetical protein
MKTLCYCLPKTRMCSVYQQSRRTVFAHCQGQVESLWLLPLGGLRTRLMPLSSYLQIMANKGSNRYSNGPLRGVCLG